MVELLKTLSKTGSRKVKLFYNTKSSITAQDSRLHSVEDFFNDHLRLLNQVDTPKFANDIISSQN